MTHIIDITKTNFDFRICFSESTIVDFYSSIQLAETVDFTVWGATLLLSPKTWGRGPRNWSPFPDDMPDDMYVSGIGTVRMNKITHGKIQVYFYDPVPKGGCIDTVKLGDGSELMQERVWTPKGKRGEDEYLWECGIAWPYGAVNLWLYSDGGTVTYEFNDEDMIPAIDFIRDTRKYDWQHH